MINFSIAPTSKFHSYPIDRWRGDPELRSVMPWSRLGANHIQGAQLCFRFVRMHDLWMGVTATASPLAYENVPTTWRRAPSERALTLLMPNTPRLVEVAGKRYVQQAGECVLTDSQAPVVGTYTQPHAAICLNIPFDRLTSRLPESEPFEGLRLGKTSTSSRIISMLLLSLWQSIEGDDELDGGRAADALLGLLARRCRRGAAADRPGERHKKICCEQVKEYINDHIRDPKLSVQGVAERIGVTTRYLQLLFAENGECVSEYIKHERLRGCLLDLRDACCDQQSITEIAFSWGFNSAAHFSSSFRRAYGLCAREYRHCDVGELAGSALADVEGPLVRALQVLKRSVRDGHRTFASSQRADRPAVA
jgi:AraC family transcriptional regulator, positive regulator of tynA and feaB